MSKTTVINIRKQKSDVYIGRRNCAQHFGNPFSVKESSVSDIRVGSLTEALNCFHSWLTGTGHHDVEPERRAWIISNLEMLRGRTIGCFCKPKACHGDVYRVLLGELTMDEILPKVEQSQHFQADLF